MAELVDVVLHAPEPARLIGEFRPHLGGDNLVGRAVAGDERHAVEIDDHAFAHELNTPSVPAMQTLAVYIRLENALL